LWGFLAVCLSRQICHRGLGDFRAKNYIGGSNDEGRGMAGKTRYRTMAPANDNTRFLTGMGNVEWVVPATKNLTKAEVETLSVPMRAFYNMVVEATDVVAKEKSPVAECAVYVISDIYGLEVKIGKATNPPMRLCQLQTGNPHKLFIHRVFWMSQTFADAVERDAHVMAERHFGRLEGEWFSCSPSDAHRTIERVIGGYNIKHCVMTPMSELWRAA
jgi:hypothetical protein